MMDFPVVGLGFSEKKDFQFRIIQKMNCRIPEFMKW